MKTILVVEDDAKLARLYRQELGDEGYRVRHADNGLEALQRVEQDAVDLVVMDINLPGINGLETLSRMLEVQPRLRVVINSSFGCYQDDFTSWAADAYVVKSSDLTELKARIAEVLALAEPDVAGQALLTG